MVSLLQFESDLKYWIDEFDVYKNKIWTIINLQE